MSKISKIRPPFKIHGGKYYLCEWIIQHFPENYEEMVYVEPFCGAASTLMNKAPSVEEAINDTDTGIIKIMRAIRDECDEFVQCLQRIGYVKEAFDAALDNPSLNELGITDQLDQAINEFVLRRMSRGGEKKTFAWTNRQRGGKPGDQNAWETIIDCLPKMAKRLEKVYIFNKNASEVLNAFNKANTLVYADPPAPEEETEAEHIKLADLLRAYKGKVIISGNPSTLYNRLYKAWHCQKKKPISKNAKPECLWYNY